MNYWMGMVARRVSTCKARGSVLLKDEGKGSYIND